MSYLISAGSRDQSSVIQGILDGAEAVTHSVLNLKKRYFVLDKKGYKGSHSPSYDKIRIADVQL